MLPDISTPPAPSRGRLSPVGALVCVVVLAAVAYGAVASLADTPRIFHDELIYMEAAASLASGDGLRVRGEPYAYGVLYPSVIAPLLAVAPDREVGYQLVKLLNALLFALTAVPAYLLARRVLDPWPSVGVAALAILVPSSVYVSVVMTESIAYLTATAALLAIVLALERPSVGRQLVALAATGVAIAARTQFVSLYAAFLVALVLAHLLLPERRVAGWRGARGLWPSAASLMLGIVLFVVLPLLRDAQPEEALGGYSDVAALHNPFTVAAWVVRHAAALELYLAVVAVAVIPIVLAAFYVLARGGSARHAAFLSSFATVNLAALGATAVVVTIQDRPEIEIDRLHDRYLFYVVPLWLVALVWWLREGAPTPRIATRVGIGLAVVLALLFPYGQLDLENGVLLFSAVGTALPAAFEEIGGSTAAAAVVTLVLVVGLLLAVFRRRGSAAKIAIGALVAVFLFNSLLVWGRAFNPPEEQVFASPGLERRWVDEAVPEGATVTMLESSCEDSILERDSYFLTEFFNDSIEDVVDLVAEDPNATVEADGSVVLESGQPLEAEYVVAQPGARLEGESLATGTAAGLTLWRVDGPVRVAELTEPESPSGFCLRVPS